ncbi:TPA: hypothetical protein ACWV58_005612, partial [Salmonella enterica subsp. enterica serovar Muenchen]
KTRKPFFFSSHLSVDSEAAVLTLTFCVFILVVSSSGQFPSLSEFVAAKGNGATVKAESRGRRRKVFAPGKKFLSEFIYPLRDDKPVLQTALREESLREGHPCCGQNEHTRHGGTAWRPQNAGRFIAGMVKAA